METRRSNAVKKRVYLPDVDEYRSSSRALNGKLKLKYSCLVGGGGAGYCNFKVNDGKK